LCFTAV